MPEPRKTSNLDLQQCAGLGIGLALTLGLCGLAGHLLDQWLSTGPLLLIGGCLLGVLAGMWNVVRTVNRLLARDRDDEAQ